MSTPVPISDLHPFEYEHPSDTQALDALEGTPGLESLSRKLVKEGIERISTIQYRGSHIHLTSEAYPEIYQRLLSVCETINVDVPPDFYAYGDASIRAFTTGVQKPVIVMSSGAIDRLDQSELAFVVGHELGHVKSRHMLYHMMARMIAGAGGVLGGFTLGIGNLLTMPLELALQRWSRMSELTADRAGLLACQDLDSVVSAFMKLAGLPESLPANKDAFLVQAREFRALDLERMNKWLKWTSIAGSSHPWTVLRAAELLKWVESGAYSEVLARQTASLAHIRFEGEVPFCRGCGLRLTGEERFCTACGRQLRDSSDST